MSVNLNLSTTTWTSTSSSSCSLSSPSSPRSLSALEAIARNGELTATANASSGVSTTSLANVSQAASTSSKNPSSSADATSNGAISKQYLGIPIAQIIFKSEGHSNFKISKKSDDDFLIVKTAMNIYTFLRSETFYASDSKEYCLKAHMVSE